MAQKIVDIIVPVFNAYDEVEACVDSVLQHTLEGFRLILINDASTDDRIDQLFSKLTDRHDDRLLLLRNDANIGFVGSVNRGMALGRNDVILLNSDTLVTPRWLQKLKICAKSSPRIGTITPFSNNAEICSFPEFCSENPIPPDPELVNLALEQAAVPVYPELPTGVGFCLYICRKLLDTIGYFDDKAFGKGYGEENDFCRNAVKAGFQNVLCDDTYIVHVGNSSFSDQKKTLVARNMAVLLEKHPDYLDVVRKFIEHDPIKPIRNMARILLHHLRQRDKPGVLHVMHGFGGGTRKYAEDLAELTSNRFRHYGLSVDDNKWIVSVLDAAIEGVFEFCCEENEQGHILLESLGSWLDIRFCHIHQISGNRRALLSAFASSTIPYGFSFHDFDLASPSTHFFPVGSDYDGFEYCSDCLAQEAKVKFVPIQQWQQQHISFLSKAKFLLAPSKWTTKICKQCFSGLNIQTVHNAHLFTDEARPDLRAFLMPNDKITTIGVMGAIGPIKGSRHLEKLIDQTRRRKLPLRWVLIGYTDRQFEPYQTEDKRFTIHGSYDHTDIKALIEHYAISLFVFPSAAPETFSYTLSEVWACGLPVLVPSVGALEERVTAAAAGWIMSNWLDMDKILNQVIELTSFQYAADYKKKSEQAALEGQSNKNSESAAVIVQLYLENMSNSAREELPSEWGLRVYQAASVVFGMGVPNGKEGSKTHRRELLSGLKNTLHHCAVILRRIFFFRKTIES